MPGYGGLEWALLILAAAAVGVTKTAMPALGTVPAALFAIVLPARESTGAVLGLLLLGDLIAVSMYHSHADWSVIRRLIPSVLAGVLLGVVVLLFADDDAVRRIIGATLIALVLLSLALLLRQRLRPAVERTPRPWVAHLYGPLGGFTTMVANASGPVMTLYFVAARFRVSELLGTAAWFFLLVNLLKLPFSIGLGLITPPSLLTNLILVPALLVGALLGRAAVSRISRRWFERIALVVTLASGLYLLA